MKNPERSTLKAVCASVLLALAASPAAQAQQIVDETSALFPLQDPSEWTNQVTVGDLDGDGDLDLVFANGGDFNTAGPDQKVRLFINRGIFFRDETDIRTGGHAGIYRGVELGDCDDDGDLDILLAQDFDRLPELLINNGSGLFTAQGSTRLPAVLLSSSRGQFGDVDNDGDLDIFIPSGAGNRFGCGQYRLYLNDGTCHYTDATTTNVPLGAVCQNMDCIFGDIDGDFDLDIRTSGTGTNNSRLYVNNGAGVYALAPVPDDTTCYSYDFGDIDNDGDLDMIGANGFDGSQAEILLLNDGAGGYSDVSGQISPNPSQDDNDSKFFDYDNDGDLDLIIARLGSGGEKVYENDGAGNFAQTLTIIEVFSDSSLDIAVADLDNNGTYDVVTAQGESGSFANRIYINNGPADTLAPRIIATEQQPDTTDTIGPYVVRASILDDMTSDRNFFDKGVFLNFSVDAGPTQSVPMLYSGGQVYRGEIPGQPVDSIVEYSVSATDFNNNVGMGGLRSFDVLGAAVAAGDIPENDPLLVTQVGGGQLQLAWGESCVSGDDDYAIYAGTLGAFTTYTPKQCSTGGATMATFVPDSGDRYFLVVPRNGAREGAYGIGNAGQRPPSTAACLDQLVGACP